MFLVLLTSIDIMKTFLIHFVFIQLVTVASLKTRKVVSITLSAAKDIPVSGFLIDNSKSEWNKEGMDQIKAVSKENSNNISVIKSRLTDINKAVNNLLNQYVHGIVPASDGLFIEIKLLYTILIIKRTQKMKMSI